MIDFLTIILLIFGVLQIILFFKVWGMTNDIKDIRNKYLKDEDEKKEGKPSTTPLLKSIAVLNRPYNSFKNCFSNVLARQAKKTLFIYKTDIYKTNPLRLWF